MGKEEQRVGYQMKESIDAIISIVDTLRRTDAFQDVMEMETEVKFGDPGFVLATEYPYVYVQPIVEQDKKETMGRVGYEVRDLAIEVGVVIDQSEYFDAEVSDVSGMRELLTVSSLIRGELRALSNRGLGGIARNVKVPSIQYEPQVRGDAFTAVAKLSLIVERQYQHQQ
jgi:hypothetical protein